MKTSLRKMLSMLLALTILLTMSGVSTFAVDAEELPATLEAPEIILYDTGYQTMELQAKLQIPQSVLDVYEKGYLNRIYDNENFKYVTDYGDWYLSAAGFQVDWKIDDGDWQYTDAWDDSYYVNGSLYGFVDGSFVEMVSVGSASTWYNSGAGAQLAELGYLIETTDGSYTYYRLDTDNHKVSVRARFCFYFYDAEYNNQKVFSDWSDTAVYGQGNKTESAAPMTLSAPVLSDLEIYDIDSYYGSPEARFIVSPTEDVLAAMMWSEQYDSALQSSSIQLIVETSLDPNFGEGSTVYKRNFSFSQNTIKYEMMFYDLWWELPTSDHDAFVWNGETLYVRAKWNNERNISGSWSEIESPYSDVLSIEGPEINAYDITVIHGNYGFDSVDGYYSESYRVTEGCELSSVYCAPLEGCYVETVTVNGTLMYDHDDESTHELLDWWSNFTAFEFLGEADYASQDLTIEITYAGTPTAQYGITTENGTGGYLYTNDRYVSWEDNSLVVYHGTAPKIYIYPDNGYEIDTVLIDGVENEQAKEDGFYTFPAITDNSHSIEVTFKRVAYRVSSWVYHGEITTDYEWFGNTDYVKIGDDITFTFAPAQDESGNYYEIDRVYIDYVLNEEAKLAGTYTFTNVQANHSIDVYYSEDPVITHDITATSGENGSISPEGVVHAREGSTQRFYFIPDDGYEVDKVTVDGVEITNLSTTEYYNIANVTEEHTIHVTFKKMPVQYDVNVIVSGHNPTVHAVSPRGETPVWEGESFTVTYSPFAGYEIEKVLVNNTEVTADGTYTIDSVNADTTIEIFFVIKRYTVTFVDHDGAVLKTETVEHGAEATAPENPTREHYVFTGWDTTFSDVTTNVTIRATYKPAEYTVKFLGWDGSVLKTETVTYTADATAPEVPEREGYDFSHWSVDYTNVSSDMEVTAVYTPKEYTVTFVDSDDSVIDTQTVKYGEAAIVPANPVKEGYTFVGWDNTGYGRVTQDMTIKAMYVEGTGVTYTVTARALGNSGSVTPVGETTALENSSLTITFTPSELSKIVKVVVDGEEIEICTSYTFENITANHTVDVYFAPTAVINVGTDDDEHGTVYGQYALIDDETVYVLEVTPADGYELDGIYIGGEKVEPELIDGRYVFRDLSDDMDIDVRFKLIVSDGDGDGDGDQSTDDNSSDDSSTDDSSTDDSSTDDSSSADDSSDPPQTGDNTNVLLWFALMTLGGLGIAAVVKKRKAAD